MQLIYDREPKRDIRHKSAIHYVKMNDVTASVHQLNIFFEMEKISGKNGWSYLKHGKTIFLQAKEPLQYRSHTSGTPYR